MSEESSRWTNAATVMRTRMRELGWQKAELVRRSGLSEPTIRSLMTASFRNGPPREHTLWAIGRALGLPNDWVDLAEREEEVPRVEPPDAAHDDDIRRLLARLDQAVRSLERRVAVIESGGPRENVFRAARTPSRIQRSPSAEVAHRPSAVPADDGDHLDG